MRAVIALLITGVIVVALAAQVGPPAQAPVPAGQTFEGTWSASGQRQTLPTEAGQPAVTVQLSGAVTITTGAGLSRGFRGEVIGFDDGAGLIAGRVVWTDEKGDRIFSVLKGEALAAGRQMRGTITGGTGRYAGIAGEYEFRWQYLIAAEGSLVNGRAIDLRGRVRAGGTRAMSGSPAGRSPWIGRLATLALALAIWFIPPPEGLTIPAWRLFAIFFAAIASVVIGAFPILTASVFAAAAAVLSGLLTPAQAYAGFANSTILLIVMAFLVARAVVKCGLGQRLGHLVVSRFGRSTLGLSYSIFLVDGLIAPAFPSNTARGGVLYPLVVGLAEAGGATPDNPARRKLGGYLMFSGMVSLSLSSALWFTAMAGNPLGAELARHAGVEITFVSWLVASSIPTLAAMLLLPWLLQRIMKPEVTSTPDAPAAAARALAALGPLSRAEWTVALTFVGMVALWASAGFIGLDSTAVALLGLGILLAAGVLTLGDIAKEGDVLATFIWFAVLYTLSGQLNEMGFMGYLGQRLAGALGGFGPTPVYLILVLVYVLLHYLFVSQTAHVLALFAVFLDVGREARGPRRAARVHAALRQQLLFGDHPAGIERESALHGERLSLPGRAVSPGRDDDRDQPGHLPGRGDTMADVRRALTRGMPRRLS